MLESGRADQVGNSPLLCSALAAPCRSLPPPSTSSLSTGWQPCVQQAPCPQGCLSETNASSDCFPEQATNHQLASRLPTLPRPTHRQRLQQQLRRLGAVRWAPGQVGQRQAPAAPTACGPAAARHECLRKQQPPVLGLQGVARQGVGQEGMHMGALEGGERYRRLGPDAWHTYSRPPPPGSRDEPTNPQSQSLAPAPRPKWVAGGPVPTRLGCGRRPAHAPVRPLPPPRVRAVRRTRAP